MLINCLNKKRTATVITAFAVSTLAFLYDAPFICNSLDKVYYRMFPKTFDRSSVLLRST